MRKSLNIFIAISILFLIFVQLWIYTSQDKFYQSLIKVVTGEKSLHLDEGSYIVYTSVKHMTGKCFTLKDGHNNTNFEFVALERTGFIVGIISLTIKDKEYYSQGIIDINKTDVYDVKIYNGNQTYVMQNKYDMDSFFQKTLLQNYLWFLAIFLLGLSVLLKVIVVIKK